MNDEITNIPKVRFKGYTEDWEQRKLGDFVVDYVEKTSVQNQFPMLTSSQQKGIVLQEDYFANQQVTTENNIGYFVLPRGYFTFRSRSDNDVFVFNRNDIIDRGIISYFYPVFTLKSADSDFFLRRINNGIQRQLSIQAEGTGQHVLSLKKFKNIVAMFPREEEQQKIGSFFKQLDDTIALHQRELDLLRKAKQTYLQKMFPKAGEDRPEIRFAGFTEPWEQRKLGDVVKFYSGLTYSPDNIQEEGTFVLRSSNVKNGEIVDADNVYVSHDVINSDNVQEGDLIVVVRNGSRDLIGKHAQIKQQMDNTVIGAFMTGVRSETPDFTNALLDTQQFAIEISKNLGATINQITTGAFKNMQFVVSKDKDERESIGTFFRSIDDTIALHQRNLNVLKEMKKSLLQQMFV
ncbi:restriction endonuclease subunit S [Enterococcus entomosocium]|uniref:restriction endonuclease subunit S n=1 Tax=Enterococcus entomosocium TaxID=3034352 RepID=UPI003D6A40ED